jgi:tetratricopeptide (TPR) repeat protein
MKYIFLLTLSCSSMNGMEKNIFANESFIKYSKKTLGEFEKTPNDLQGVALCHNGKIQEGLLFLKNQANIKKDDPEYWNHIGNCHFLNNDYMKAKFYYTVSLQTAERKNIKYPSALNNIGIVYLSQKNIKGAVEAFTKVHQQAPELAIPLYNLGQIYLEYGYFSKSIECFVKLYGMNQKDPDILSSLGSAYSRNKNFVESEKYFKAMSRSDLKGYPECVLDYVRTLIGLNLFKDSKKILSYYGDKENEEYKTLEKLINEGLKK